jgi:hypothetical protein
MTYSPIVDWSPEGRRALVAALESELRCLLEETFTAYLDEPGASLAEFGFRGDDPVLEAADWALARFRDGDMDPIRIRPADRTLRLFTRARFWLAQRAGSRGFHRIEAARADGAGPGAPTDDIDARPAVGVGPTDTLLSVARGVKSLAERTCPTMVDYWLRGTTAMRAVWFEWDSADEPVPSGLSGKEHSFHTADALFRFSAIFAKFVPQAGALAARACVETWFTPCQDAPPFRVAEDVVAARLRLGSPREAQRERHAGMVQLIGRVLHLAETTVGLRDADGAVLRACIRTGLLNAYRIEDEKLAGRLAALPREL